MSSNVARTRSPTPNGTLHNPKKKPLRISPFSAGTFPFLGRCISLSRQRPLSPQQEAFFLPGRQARDQARLAERGPVSPDVGRHVYVTARRNDQLEEQEKHFFAADKKTSLPQTTGSSIDRLAERELDLPDAGRRVFVTS